MAEILEIIMVVSFGISWPINVIKSYRSRTTKGQSLAFLLLILFGYIAGITSKLLNEAYMAGTDAVALRYPLLKEMMSHVLTTKAEALFSQNWANVKGEDVSYMKERIKLSGLAE